MEKVTVKKNWIYAFLKLIWGISLLVLSISLLVLLSGHILFSLVGGLSYIFLGFPTIDATPDKLVYSTGCDNIAIIKTTAFMLATPSEGNPLTVIVTSPTGKIEPMNYTPVDKGTYISIYTFENMELGTYTVVAKVKSHKDHASFIMINETLC